MTHYLLRPALAAIGLLTGAVVAGAQPAPDFVPDQTITGSRLTGWQPSGAGHWTVKDGVVAGTAPAGGAGGWLIVDRSYQDVAAFARVRCVAACEGGILLRAERGADGLTGLLVTFSHGAASATGAAAPPSPVSVQRVTIDTGGRVTMRDPLLAPPTGTGRVAPAPDPAAAPPKPPAPPRWHNVTVPELVPPALAFHASDWNAFDIVLDANILRPSLNRLLTGPRRTTDDGMGYGAVALYVAPGSSIEWRDVSLKDLGVRTLPAEKVSPGFRAQRLDDFYYAWGVAVADVNRDGIDDIIAGPSYYLGPTYETKREIYIGSTYSPGTQYSANMVTHARDFTGDGWPDVLATEGRAMVLYVNPGKEARRWPRHPVVPDINTELTLLQDLDGDGIPELIYGFNGTLCYAKVDPANPTARWAVREVSGPGMVYTHGMGIGDINGDGRPDIVQAAGWWEQPAPGATGPWPYHPQAFSRWGRLAAGPGGGSIAIYDVNGDGLNDVVTTLDAHDWGLAWYEQRRDRASGAITFVRHMIMDDLSTKNAGGVAFSELHGAASADIDGDGIPDFVTGKRFWAHLDGYGGPDPYGAPVLYWFRTVRNPKAPGGAEFVPELVHNRSGIGSQLALADVNRDGRMDIITATTRGVFVFWGVRLPGAAARDR